MGWAHWRDQFSTKQNAVRLHLRWRLFEPGVVYVGDRNYSGDYGLLRRMDEIGASFVVRLQEIYKQRWTIELFFRWLKCLLPCRHWLAESEAQASRCGAV